MTVLLHVHSGNLYGGVESLMGSLARQSADGVGPTQSFGLCFDGRLHDELMAAGATVHDLGPARLRSPLSVLRARRRLGDLLTGPLREAGPAAALVHSAWSLLLFGPVLRRHGWRTAFWFHGGDGNGRLERWAAKRQPDVVLANSEHTRPIASRLFPAAPVRVVRPPVEDPGSRISNRDRAAIRAELETPDTAPVVLQVSRMEAWKGHRVLLEAAARLRQARGEAASLVLWIVGGAQREEERRYRAELEALADRLGLGRAVRFIGESQRVAELLAAADLFCQPNTEPEPFGMVFVEALYAGLPVVATDHGGAREILTPACGLAVPPGEAASLAEALGGLIADPERRRRLGVAGPERARELCDPAAQARRLERAIFESEGSPA